MRARDFPYLDVPHPIGLAHRGGAAYGPNLGIENTAIAFRNAVALGYQYVETDVHATSDGVLVAFHDVRLDRVTDRTGRVAELPWSEVRQALVGGREPIPLLADLLEQLPTTRFNVDVKAAGAVAPLIELIRSHDAVDRVCVGSFSAGRLHAVRQALGPRLATAAGQLGTAGMRYGPRWVSRWLATPAPVLQIPERYPVGRGLLRLVDADVVRRVHALGRHLHVWTVDDRAAMERLLDWGVDGVVTDRIDTLRDVLAERGWPLTA